MEEVFPSATLRWLLLATVFLVAPRGAAQSHAPYVWIEIPQHAAEPSHGALPSVIGRRLTEWEQIQAVTVVVGMPGDSTELGCEPIAGDLAGRIAVIRRGGCSSTVKGLHAEAAGAAAVLLFNDVEPGSVLDTAIVWSDGPSDTAAVAIPVSFTRAITGAILRGLGTPEITYSGTGTCFDYNGTPDPTPAWRYHPLAVGNVWEYDATFFMDPDWRERRDVTGDTLVDGRRYFIMRAARYDRINPGLPTSILTTLVRFDTLRAMPVTRLPDGTEAGGTCPLDVPSGVALPGCGSVSIQGAQKRFDDCYAGLADGGHHWSVVQAGRGPIGTYYQHLFPPIIDSVQLIYSRVDGVEIGSPVVWPVAAGEPPQSATSALRIYPSPAHGSAVAAFALPAAGEASMDVLDVLGRRVVTHHLGRRPAGAGEVVLDVSRLAPGRYHVRLVGEGDLRLMTPLVIAR